MPWVLIMFGVAIIYNLVFRKINDTTQSKKHGADAYRGPQNHSADLNKSWKTGKSAYKSAQNNR